MKKLLIILILTSFTISAQDRISFSVLHDVKLGLGLDKEHGNDTYTTDVILNANLEGKQFEYYYFAMQVQYEYANLSGGLFHRYSVHGIWNLNKLIIPKLEIGFGGGIGMINRENQYGLFSYSGTLDISYPITKNLYVIQKNEWVHRPDLITPKIGYNLSVGLKYKI